MEVDEEKRYPLIFFEASRARLFSLGFMLLVIAGAGGFFLWYSRVSKDLTPDSIAGYSFAILGTFFALMAGIRFSLYRRSRKRGLGQLNGSLNWHIAFAVIAFFLLMLHSFGNFNPRSGTFALYAMIALVVCGFIGRTLDQLAPRVMAKQVTKALSAQGEDRSEAISQQLQTMLAHNKQDVSGFKVMKDAGKKQQKRSVAPVPRSSQSIAAAQASFTGAQNKQSLQTPWDLAYISLDELPQELSRDAAQYRFVPDRKSDLERPGGLMPGVREQLQELQKIEHALQREQFYRYLIRYWRIFHICLAVLTLGLTLWHIEFALSLLLPVWLHH